MMFKLERWLSSETIDIGGTSRPFSLLAQEHVVAGNKSAQLPIYGHSPIRFMEMPKCSSSHIERAFSNL